MSTPDPATQLEMYRRMLRIRRFDETVKTLFDRGRIPGSVHLSIGQEAEVVGACMALAGDDYMVGNHRSHGHPIGKGAAMGPLLAEILGKATGVNGGKGGSMHLADFSVGSLGESSIVGSGLPVAVGAALGARMQGNGRVCLCFFGDGASNEGYFHEALNMASAWQVPVVFLCENNSYGVTTAFSRVSRVPDVATRAVAYGIPGEIVDGQDARVVYAAVQNAAQRARDGAGPTLIEAKTYRYPHHSEGPLYNNITYRDPAELAAWQARDPLPLFAGHLAEAGIADAALLADIEQAISAEVASALEFAEQSPWPDPAEAHRGLYRTPIAGFDHA
ncbi:thiamine pyrophosphate-dependent dehydrogenase E1 component subunit alpha [Immundisolibacter sp.]|uniref:thiamine pyrophosphate-dependent dehydrogenase E1 component subunit alpha n=1 Tax=Immundisolibacter sp. TaxID=1934948 RepID=UPI0035663816